MRIRLFNGLTICAFLFTVAICGLAADASLKADRVEVIKHERVLRLFKDGKVIKTYKVALGGNPVGPKTQKGDHKTPEGNYTLDRRTHTVSFISRFTSLIRIRKTEPMFARKESLPEETFSFTVCPTDTDGSGQATGLRIGPTGALR